jgi:ABC-type transport system substrate-binding protein
MYVVNAPQPLASAQAVKQQLAAINLEVELKPLPVPALFSRIVLPGEPWDLFISLWTPDFVDPFQYLNALFDGQYAGTPNLGRFDSPVHNARMRRAGRLQGVRRYEAYGDVDVQLARDGAPAAAVNFLNEATLVSKRVGCVVLRPWLDLTAVCLK